MKQYKFEIIVKEGYDEWWEELNKSGKTGCDEILEELETILFAFGIDSTVKLINYEDIE